MPGVSRMGTFNAQSYKNYRQNSRENQQAFVIDVDNVKAIHVHDN